VRVTHATRWKVTPLCESGDGMTVTHFGIWDKAECRYWPAGEKRWRCGYSLFMDPNVTLFATESEARIALASLGRGGEHMTEARFHIAAEDIGRLRIGPKGTTLFDLVQQAYLHGLSDYADESAGKDLYFGPGYPQVRQADGSSFTFCGISFDDLRRSIRPDTNCDACRIGHFSACEDADDKPCSRGRRDTSAT
jgi:hypothetical protein